MPSKKTTNNEKGFNFLCSSKDDLDYCLVRSPRNDTYGPVKRGSTASCANTTYSICLEIVDNECVVHFKTIVSLCTTVQKAVPSYLPHSNADCLALQIFGRQNIARCLNMYSFIFHSYQLS